MNERCALSGFEEFQQGRKEALVGFDMREVADAVDFLKRGVRYGGGACLPELRIGFEGLGDIGNDGVFAKGRAVALADDEEGGNLDAGKFVNHGLGEDHGVGERLIPRDA